MNDQRLYQTVAQSIVELIGNGFYPPGSRLPAERNLAEQFNVSRVTIRQAQIALQAQGKVEIKTGSGVYVLDESEQDHGALPAVSAFEVTEARSLIESEVAALAARNIDDETLARLADYLEKMATTNPEDEAEAQLADRDFHLAIAAASGNSAARHVVELLWKMRTELPQVKEVYDAVCLKDTSERGDEHSDILVALQNHDPSAARTAMRSHFRRLLESMLSVTEEQALEQIRKKTSESRQRFLNTAGI